MTQRLKPLLLTAYRTAKAVLYLLRKCRSHDWVAATTSLEMTSVRDRLWLKADG